MIFIIAVREIKNLLREKTFWVAASLLMLLLVTALFTSSVSVKRLNKERAAAQRMSREGWLTQPPKNPHSAAHYGNFAFRIKSPLSFFDNGLDAYTGTYLFLEPHKQNGDKFSQAQESTSLLRFGELTPAMVLQNLLPLLIVFVCFASISREKENNTIKLLFTQGCNMRQVVGGKILGNFLAFAALLIPFFFIAAISVSSFSEQKTDMARLMLLFAAYLLYTTVWISVTVLISAHAASSRSALMKLLFIWMLAVIIVPKVSANIGSILYKTPSQFQMATLVNKDIEEGIDGHNPYDKRRDVLMQATMKKYKVTKEQDLPVNFDAIAMIESEKYTTDVFRKRKAEVDEIFEKQNAISEWAAFLNPAQAMQYSSMALCGTDFNHFRDFQNQAEEYRLYYVNVMNEYMSTHTKTGDWKTSFGKETYELTTPFIYQPVSLSFALQHQPLSFGALIFWAIACTILIALTNRIKLL
jgi:ABC-2 type transport system permease protein